MARSFDVNKIQRDLAKLTTKMDMIIANSPYTKDLAIKLDKKKVKHLMDFSSPSDPGSAGTSLKFLGRDAL